MPDKITRLNAALEGRYRIERQLGEGGMATVYLVDDLKHERRVALKVLKPELAAMIGGERFVAEIKTTANLQHPHILPLFDSGEADGFLYYVMPYVEGENLRDKLDREKQMGVEEALKLTRDVADALDYAHRNGVIHRDIKPENILLHDGRPVVADFGIAVAISAAGGGRMTETGLSLGTPHYMSPEQATADRDLSPRSDVYSLACVLYEMLAGDPPHTGPSAQAILVRILTEAPRSVTDVRTSVPSHVSAVLRKALEKLPADRFESAKEFADALENEAFTYHARQRAHVEAAPVAPAPAPTARWGALLPWGVAAAAVLVAGAALLWPQASGPVHRFAFELDAQPQIGPQIAISPDGSRIVYRGPEGRLWVRMLSSLESTAIPESDGGRAPFFSPDGRSVGFTQGPANADFMATVSLTGAPPVRLTPAGGDVNPGGAWSEDGYVYYTRAPEGDLWRVPAQGGNPEPFEFTGALGATWPEALPGGRAMVVLAEFEDGSAISILDLQTREVTPIGGATVGGTFARYAGGHLFWITDGAILMAARFDPKRLELTSPAIALASDVSTRWLGSAEFAVSDNGTLILGVGSRISGGESIGWLDRSGQSNVIDERLATDVGDFDFVSLSPDGRFIATEIQSGSDGAADEEHRIQIYDIEQTTLYQLSFEGQRNRMPRWLADGRVAYLSDQGEVNGIYAQPFDRSGAPELLFETSGAIAGFDAVPLPGVPLVLWTSRGEGPTDSMPQGVYVVPDTPDGSLTALVASRFMEAGAAISPDGRWVAYVSDESERPEIFVRAYPDGGRPFPISTEGGIAPTWGASSETLFYVEPNRMVQAVELEVSPSGVRVASRSELFPAAGVESNDRAYSSRLDVSLDGQSLLAVLESNRASASSADVGHVVVLNVFAEIEQRLEATGR